MWTVPRRSSCISGIESAGRLAGRFRRKPKKKKRKTKIWGGGGYVVRIVDFVGGHLYLETSYEFFFSLLLGMQGHE